MRINCLDASPTEPAMSRTHARGELGWGGDEYRVLRTQARKPCLACAHPSPPLAYPPLPMGEGRSGLYRARY